jgi:hypothetical protein
MFDFNLTEALGQVSSSKAAVIFGNFLRGGVRQLIYEVTGAEVNETAAPQALTKPQRHQHFQLGVQTLPIPHLH